MTLRQKAELAAQKWCICDDGYTRLDRVDPACRCDLIAEALEDFATVERREFAEKALRIHAGRDQLLAGGHSVAKLDRHIAAAIAEAEKE